MGAILLKLRKWKRSLRAMLPRLRLPNQPSTVTVFQQLYVHLHHRFGLHNISGLGWHSLYAAYHLLCRLGLYRQTNTSDQTKESAKEDRLDGVVIQKSVLTKSLLDDVPTSLIDRLEDENRSAKRPFLTTYSLNHEEFKQVSHLLTEEIQSVIKHILRSSFLVTAASIQRTVPSDVPKRSSWLWHLDYAPNCYLQVFIYLNDVFKDTGATQVHPRHKTKKLVKLGFIDRYHFTPIAKRALDNPENYLVVEGNKGSVFMVSVGRCIHRATYPMHNHRDVLVFGVLPSIHSKIRYYECINKIWNNPIRFLLT